MFSNFILASVTIPAGSLDLERLSSDISFQSLLLLFGIQATRCCVLVSHSGCIWDIKNLPCENLHDSSLACAARGCSGGVSFATCSADGTIRFWDLLLQPVSSVNDLTLATNDNSLLNKQDKSTCLGNHCAAKPLHEHGFLYMYMTLNTLLPDYI